MLTTHDDPARAVIARRRRRPRRRAPRSAALHARRPRDDALHQRAHRAQGRRDRAHHDRGLRATRSRSDASGSSSSTTSPSRSRSRSCPGDRRLEVAERVGADGTVRRPLDREELVAALAAPGRGRRGLDRRDVPARVREPAPRGRGRPARSSERHPEIFTTASHEVAPEIREFERASTTVANAYIKPLAHQYLGAHGAAARRAADPGAAPAHALERRPDPRGRGAADAGPDARVRARRGRDRRRLLRPR